MGDRANFGFKSGNDTIFLYGHWAGYQMLGQLADAVMVSRPRWGDDAYATRIAITHIVNQDRDSLTETGWGISVNSLCDNEHKVPVVDWNARTVSLHAEDDAVNQEDPLFVLSLAKFTEKYLLTPVS
jgi:hypothetical protein